MRNSCYYILSFLAVGLLLSCSTQKNTKASRFYHAFTTRYNIYYNGKVSFDESLKAMQDGYKENYSEQILMYPISAQPKDKATPGGPFDRAIEKSNKAIKLHSIQVKPLKKPGWRNDPKQVAIQAQEEYNPFLKNSWLMLGQAQFYNADFLQAAATFSYISRHYATDELVTTEARIWQARCYSEMDWFFEAEDALNKLNINGIPKKNLNLYAAVNADLLVKETKFEEAIPYLQTAIKAEKNKLQRTRMKYLLGQLYASLGLDGLAYTQFGQVAGATPPYELEFAARIRQTEVFTGGNYQKEVKKLQSMARSEKNKDMLDQVYYALGNIYINRQDTVNAITNYRLGIEKSTRNGLDKAICQIRLGDIYFAQRDYVNAQPCYSGALAAIQKEHKDYKRVAKLSEILDELVVHVEAVHLQDSLQTIARMPEAERLAVIDKIIEKVKKDEEEAKAQAEKDAYLAQQEANNPGINRPGTEINTATLPTTGAGTFYFYNPQTVAQGKTQFQRLWGRRVLEDNWRRRNKTMTTFEAEEENAAIAPDTTADQVIPADSLADTQADDIANDPKTRAYYIQQLPLTPEDIESSNLIIVDGLYHMAMIYKDRLEDLPLSIEGFETLDNRFPDNEHKLESYYQIYLMALRMGESALAEAYKAKLIAAFPDSDYALAIADPNYEYNIRTMDRVQDSIYQKTYQHYLAGDVQPVRQYYQLMNEKYPLANLMPKFMFLDALTYVETGDVEGFKEALKALVEKYPKADVTELAGEMLKGVLRGRSLVQGSVRGMTWNMRFGVGEGELSAEDAARTFKAETNTAFRMLLIYPTGSLDKNQLLFTVAAFNFANFIVKEFDVSVEESGPISMLAIDGFYNFEEVLHYYKMIYDKDGYATALSKEITVLPISKDNYETLMRGKTVEEYIDFFEEHFGELAPDMLARWSTRYEADMQEAEEAAEQPSEQQIQQPVERPATEQQLTPPPVQQADTTIVAKDTVPAQFNLPDTVIVVPQPDIPVPVDTAKVDETTTVRPETAATPQDSIPATQAPEAKRDLTLKEIEEIRQREEAEEAVRKEAERLAKEESERLAREQKEQEEKDRAAQLKQKQEEQAEKAKTRKEREKQVERERKAKEKARLELQRQKEREYKERLKQLEKERKQKEAEYQKKLREREKARKK